MCSSLTAQQLNGLQRPFWEGTEVLPAPDAVAAWVVVMLTYPALAAAHEQVQFRDHGVIDPDFEARLAKYAPGS